MTVDEVYVNGKVVGSIGRFLPDYETPYDLARNGERSNGFDWIVK